MDEPEGFLELLNSSLVACDGSTFEEIYPLFEWAGFQANNSVLSFDPEVARFWLRGFAWDAPAPWED